LHFVFEKFKKWAADCDGEGGGLRSKKYELAWMEQLGCPVLKIESDLSVKELIEKVREMIEMG
jgi:hypothetical protein